SGRFPRATAKRDRKADAKKLREQKAAFQKYVQQMQKPVRHGEMQQILQHIDQNMIAPKLKRLEDLVDKLQLLPDFIGNCLNDEGKFDIEPSLETFEDYFEKYMKKLEEEQKAEEERLEAEAKAKAEKEKETTEKLQEEMAKAKEEASSGEEGEPVKGQATAADKEEQREDVQEQDDECSCESDCEKCTPDPKDTPETEETQKE
ncbi:MAG: hypothetical protein KAR39_12650, partial [Thermoplasmata archaeon]|nr:hypothetical protein [Thermoplasmata archaeon]